MEKEQCIFCKIANGIIPSEQVYEDDEFKVFLDLNPASKGHALIVPKVHAENVEDLDDDIAKKVMLLAARIGKGMKASLGCTGYNLLQNNGVSAGQTVFHFHMHVIPRYDGCEEVVSMLQGNVNGDILKETARKIKSAL